MDVDEHLDLWVRGYDSPNTRRSYRRIGTEWLAWCATNGVDPLNVGRGNADEWRTAPSPRRSRPAPRTQALRIVVAASFCNYLLEERVIELNPFVHVRRPKIDPDQSDTRGLTRTEAASMLDTTQADVVGHCLVCLMMLEGLRVSEAISADIEHLHINRGSPVLTVTRKGGERQSVPLGPHTYSAVLAAAAGRTKGPILAKANDGRYSYTGISSLLRRWVIKAGIDDPRSVSPHSARHTFVTLSLDSGAALRDVQDAAGHSDPRSTRRYDRSRGAADRHPTAVLEEFLMGPPGPA